MPATSTSEPAVQNGHHQDDHRPLMRYPQKELETVPDKESDQSSRAFFNQASPTSPLIDRPQAGAMTGFPAPVAPMQSASRSSIQMQPEENESEDLMEGKSDTAKFLSMVPNDGGDDEGKQTPGLQFQSVNGKSQASPAIETQLQQSRGAGEPLPGDVASEMGNKIGADFSQVNIHTDSQSAQMNKELGAKAFTHGQDIYFNQGQYAPGSNEGKKLLAHELTHTVQQNRESQIPRIQRKIMFHELVFRPFSFRYKTRQFSNADTIRYKKSIGLTNHKFDDIIIAKGKEYSFVSGRTHKARKKYRRKLIKDIIQNIHDSSQILYFKSKKEFVTEVRKRAVTSLDMRATQGKNKRLKPTGYPPGTQASWAAIASSKARNYWVVTIVSGDYNFTLSNTGKNDAYEALKRLLFSHERSKNKRTLMHCDYLISAIHYKVMAEAMEISKFNTAVRNGSIVIKLQDLSIDKIIQKQSESKANKSLMEVELNSENDLIIGDHVIFYNHPSYDRLNAGIGQSWRLENAILIDNSGPGKSRRFQGHGYFSPKTRAKFIKDMRKQLVKLVNKGMYWLNRYKRNRTTANENRLRAKFPNMKYKDAAGNLLSQPTVRYREGGTWVETPLTQLRNASYSHPFARSSTSKIEVYRPMESRLNL